METEREKIKKELKSTKGFILSPTLAKKLGTNAALFLSVLADVEYEVKPKDGWFHAGVHEIEEETGFSYYLQAKAIKKLEEAGILEHKNMDLPQKRFFKFNYDQLKKMMEVE